MDHLDKLEAESIFILREAYNKIHKLGMLWSFGKDSNVMLWLARKAFFGNLPFPLIHCDTELEMPEVYEFRDRYEKEWNVRLIRELCPGLETTDSTLPASARVAARKTGGLNNLIERENFTGIFTGIRRDEESTRAKERYFSVRGAAGEWDIKSQPPEFWNQYNTDFAPNTHVRIHPLLHWTELDIWQYIKRENIPVVSLYFARYYNGKMMRFRSIGEIGITHPLPSIATTIEQIIEEIKATKTSERAGRPMGADEDATSFERLRIGGYM